MIIPRSSSILGSSKLNQFKYFWIHLPSIKCFVFWLKSFRKVEKLWKLFWLFIRSLFNLHLHNCAIRKSLYISLSTSFEGKVIYLWMDLLLIVVSSMQCKIDPKNVRRTVWRDNILCKDTLIHISTRVCSPEFECVGVRVRVQDGGGTVGRGEHITWCHLEPEPSLPRSQSSGNHHNYPSVNTPQLGCW